MEKDKQIVTLQSIFENSEWQNSNARLPLALGKDINGNVVVPDLTHLSHLLITLKRMALTNRILNMAF